MSTFEDGSEVGKDVALAGEGATKYSKTSATGDSITTPELGMELTDEVVLTMGSMAKVRLAVKRSRREAKRRRVKRVYEKAVKIVHDDVQHVELGHRATMDFDRSEVLYDECGREMIIPFRTTTE
ncbi:Gag-pol fusion protein [Phytophthora cinnamomi]|uniref:Gag-pol fusion protein n=1 Tax=Phytophthora cinnamomi TaxID=4785 RepID=UPI00355A87FE|nr:Gag-pol fusion protein [Phytophthora cinnamomi]